MIKLSTILKEAKKIGIIYHHTKYSSAIKILQSDSLRSSLNPLDSSNSFDEAHTISFTKDPDFHGNFEYNDEGGDECRLVIDGTKLSKDFKLEDYSDSEWESDAEEEIRIVDEEDKFSIPILKYLKEVDCLEEPEDPRDYKALIRLLEKKKIPYKPLDGF
jgi:hypothetical protein